MKKFILFFLITFFLFSCTIEKRRYFKGYHVENGRMGPFDRLRDRGNGEVVKRDPSTGSGTREVGKRKSGEELKSGPLANLETEAILQAQKWEESEKQQSGTSETIEPEKAQKVEIVIGEIESPLIVKEQMNEDHALNNEEEQVQSETTPKQVWGMLAAFLATALLIVFIGFQLAVDAIELFAAIAYVFLLITLIPLALLFGILFAVRLTKLNRSKRMKNATPPEEYKE